jgi:uncharacterized membrane protein YfcA
VVSAPVLAATAVLAVAVGVTLGLLGGGGSILTVPLLVYVAGLPPQEAITTSLFVVGTTAAVGAVGHARAGRVRWRTGAVFGAVGMAGALVGGLVGARLPGAVLLSAFALMMLATSVAMIRGRRRPAPERAAEELPVLRVVAQGAAVGLVTGLVGAGGGFLVVPALALLGGLPMPVAVGTSLVVIAMQSAAGFAGHLTGSTLDWTLTLVVTAAAVAGSLVGGRLVGRIAPDLLRRGFGWFVLGMGALVLAEQLPAPARVPALLVLGVVGAGVVAAQGIRVARRTLGSTHPGTR